MEAASATLEGLPVELLAHILSFLPSARWLMAGTSACHRFRAVADAAGLWRAVYTRRFLSHDPFTAYRYDDLHFERPDWEFPHFLQIKTHLHVPSTKDMDWSMRCPGMQEGRWKECFIRDMRWVTEGGVEPIMAKLPANVCKSRGKSVLIDDRATHEPSSMFVSCSDGQIRSLRLDREEKKLINGRSFNLGNPITNTFSRLMGNGNTYQAALHQLDDLLFAQSTGKVKVFRKGGSSSHVAVSVGDGWPTLAINKQKHWMAMQDSAFSKRSNIVLHEINSGKQVMSIRFEESRRGEPGLVMKENYLVIGCDRWLYLYDLRSGKYEKELPSHTYDRHNAPTRTQCEQDEASNTFLITSRDGNSTQVFSWDTLEQRLCTAHLAKSVSYNQDMIAFGIYDGLHIIDMHSTGYIYLSHLGASEFAYADHRKAISVAQKIEDDDDELLEEAKEEEEQQRIAIYDLTNWTCRSMTHPGGADRRIDAAVTHDLLVTASKSTVAVWDFFPSLESSSSSA